VIENVQRRFTKRLKGLSALSYDDRLKLLNLEWLEIRRLRFDLLCCCKIIFGLMRIDREAFFELRVPQEVIHINSLNTTVAFLSGQTSLPKESQNAWNSLPADRTDFSS